MDKAALLTLFRCGVPLTWLLFVPALTAVLSWRGALRKIGLWALVFSATGLAVVTIDAMRAGVWG
jgi:putative effector of murein hydrolase LrgA (UPF0299 family)